MGFDITKYDIYVNNKITNDYFKYLINSFYKSLTIFEGKDYKTKEIMQNSETSYTNYKLFIENFSYEIAGGYKLFGIKEFITLLVLIESMNEIKPDEHRKLRKLVFSCIDAIEKIQGGVVNGSDIL
jgi:hypothetical protein